MSVRFEAVKHLVHSALGAATTQSSAGGVRRRGKDFMREDLTHGAEYAG